MAGRIEWVGFQNQSGQNIPPFSIIQARGWQMPDPSGSDVSATTPVINGNQPSGSINPSACYITSSGATAPGGYGVCARPTPTTPLLVALAGPQQDKNDGPFRMCGPAGGGSSSGDTVGGSSGGGSGSGSSWGVTRDFPGFLMVDLPQQGYALVVPSQGPYLGQVPSSAGKPPLGGGTSVNVTVMSDQGGVGIGLEVPTQAVVKVYNRFLTIPLDQTFLFDWTGEGWEVVCAENILLIATINSIGGEMGQQATLALTGEKVAFNNQLGFTLAVNAIVFLQTSLQGPFPYDLVSMVQNGQVVRGVLQGVLNQGGSANITTAGGATIKVFEVLGLNGGNIPAGKNVVAFFNPDTKQFEVIAAGC
jgi:hypothetical protein